MNSYWLKPKEIYRDLRYQLGWRLPGFFHRGLKGWAKHDTWSFDHYLADVIAPALEYMAEHTHGVPPFIFEENNLDPENVEDSKHGMYLWRQWLYNKARWFRWYSKDEIGFRENMTDEEKSQALDFYEKQEKHFLEVVLPDFGKRFQNLWD
jgi:hypothetical protein